MNIEFSRAGQILTRSEAIDLAVKGTKISVSPVDDNGIPFYGLGVDVRTANNGNGDRVAWVSPSSSRQPAENAAYVARSIQTAAEFAGEVDARLTVSA